MKDDSLGLIVILGLVAIALMGGSNNSSTQTNTRSSVKPIVRPITPVEQQRNIAQEIRQAQAKVELLKKQVQAEIDKKTESPYKGIVTLAQINRSKDPGKEYAVIRVKANSTSTIDVTGWRLTSTNTGNTVTIPKGSYLFFTAVVNSEENIKVTGGDVIYLLTGISPLGVSFKVNKCTGYLTQFQTFTPYISNSCPLPRNEDLSKIAKIVSNDACLDYINSLPACRVPTKNLPVSFTFECSHFISDKVNYPSCVNTHKTDPDFYKHEWRVYLKRSASLWKDRRENIILYDNLGKKVSTLTY